MDRKAKYIIAGLILFIILMIIIFFIIFITGIAAYFLFLTPTGNVVVATDSNEIASNEFEDGWDSIESKKETECIENWKCTEWTECLDGKQTRTCTDENNCDSTKNKPIESQECEIELTEIQNIKINSFNFFCTPAAPTGFSSGGIGIRFFEIENIGHDLIEVNGLIKVSITLNDKTDSSIEFEENFSLEKGEKHVINLRDAYSAGWNRAFLYVQGKTGLATVKIDLPNNEFIEITRSITGNYC